MNRLLTVLLVPLVAFSLSFTAVDAKSPTAKCKDGTYSYSKHRQGTCSHHGGVATWYK